jgi:hypothetical protein
MTMGKWWGIKDGKKIATELRFFFFFLSYTSPTFRNQGDIKNTKQCQDFIGCCVALGKHQRPLKCFVLGDEGMLGRCLKMTRMMVSARECWKTL